MRFCSCWTPWAGQQYRPEAPPAPDAGPDSSYLDQALAEARRVAHTGNRIFILSDFLTLSDDTPGLLGALGRHNQVTALRIRDPLERQLPARGRYAVATASGPSGSMPATRPSAGPGRSGYRRMNCG